MYFVVECTTSDAPRSRGRWRIGVANVLSTQSGIFAWVASSATAAMSNTFSIGLLGVSIHTSLVFGRSAFFTRSIPSAPPISTKVASSPIGFITLSKIRNVPPYTSSPQTT